MNTPQILKAALARRSFSRFCMEVYPGFEIAPHHALMISYLEKLIAGSIKRLMITTAPRHGKTTLGSVLLPAYCLGRDPKKESIISVSYGAELSESWGRKVRNIMTDGAYQGIFPGAVISADSSAQYRFDLLSGSSYVATGRMGPLTGRGASLLILDDLTKDAAEASSPAIMKSVCEWVDTVAFTRLSPNARVLSIATRWSGNDPQAHLLRQGDWTVLSLPAFCESEDDPLKRPIGAPLWPSRFSAEILEQTKRDIGSRAFQVLYQQNPTAAAGNIFQRNWLQTYTTRPAFSRIIQSWDCASKTGTANDFSVCSTWGVGSNGYYLLSIVRKRMEFVELKATIAALAEEWRPEVILVEDSSAGASAIQELKSSTVYPILAIKADKSKVSRAEAVSPSFEAGKIFLPEGAWWLDGLIDELCAFPNGQFDDQVDSVSQFLNYVREEGGGRLGVVEHLIGVAKGIFNGGKPKPKAAAVPMAHAPGSSKPALLPAALCPTCGLETRIRLGSSGNPFRCVNDGTQFLPGGTVLNAPHQGGCTGCTCITPRLEARRPFPGGVRCDDCTGIVSDATENNRWPHNGISRAQYQRGDYGRRWRN